MKRAPGLVSMGVLVVLVGCSGSGAQMGGRGGGTAGGGGGDGGAATGAGGGGIVIGLDGGVGAAGIAGSGGVAGPGGMLGGDGGSASLGGASGASGAPGTWVATPNTGGSVKGKGDAGAADSGAALTCTPNVSGAVITACGYPYSSSVPLTSVAFNESEVLRAVRAEIDSSGGTVSLLYNDEHALTLGVHRVVVKSAAGTTTTDFPLSPLSANPGSVTNPLTGTNELTGNNSGLDPSLRPLWPVLYITDVTSDANSRSGDWQMGGRPINPSAVFGTWKGAIRTVDSTTSTVSVTPDPDPTKNNWNLGINEPIPAGIANEGWSAEVKWKVSFQSGHSYRMQVIVHDGDQNKLGGDCGEACVIFCAGGTTNEPECPSGKMACGSNDMACNEGDTCVNGCCEPLNCPGGATVCGPVGPSGALVSCAAGSNCVSGCCVSDPVIY